MSYPNTPVYRKLSDYAHEYGFHDAKEVIEAVAQNYQKSNKEIARDIGISIFSLANLYKKHGIRKIKKNGKDYRSTTGIFRRYATNKILVAGIVKNNGKQFAYVRCARCNEQISYDDMMTHAEVIDAADRHFCKD